MAVQIWAVEEWVPAFAGIYAGNAGLFNRGFGGRLRG
jgi:hypothetical protein